MQEFLQGVSTFGFPVVVAAYTLFRMEGKVEKLDQSISGREGLIDKIDTLSITVATLSTKMEKLSALIESKLKKE